MERLTKKCIGIDWSGNEVEFGSVNDNLPFAENSHDFKKAIIQRCYEYEQAEEEGLLVKADEKCVNIPVNVGCEVFIVCTCKEVMPKLDGELYEICGGYGSATGYYCPYENDCPFGDIDGCESVEGNLNVFKDIITEIQIYEDGISLLFEDCKYCDLKDLGKTVFLTEAEAIQELEKREKDEVNKKIV